MKSTKAAREAATLKQQSASNETGRTALVSTTTATKIADLAERYSIAPAVIAGTIAEIGMEFLNDESVARAASLDSARCYWNLITRWEIPKARTSVPILITEYLAEGASRLEKGMNRSREELLGQFIEMAILRYAKKEVLRLSIGDLETAMFHYKAVMLREEYEGCPEALELLKPAPKTPPAFIAFEKILAAKGGAA